MVSALDTGVNGLGPNPGQGHSVVFLGKTLNSHSAPSPPRCINGYWQCNAEGNHAMDQCPIQGLRRNTPSHLMAENGNKLCPDEPPGRLYLTYLKYWCHYNE